MQSATFSQMMAAATTKQLETRITVPARVGGAQARNLISKAQQAMQENGRYLVLDMAETADLGTHGIVALRAINQLLRQERGERSRVRLLNARRSLLRVLHGYGFSDYTLIYGDC